MLCSVLMYILVFIVVIFFPLTSRGHRNSDSTQAVILETEVKCPFKKEGLYIYIYITEVLFMHYHVHGNILSWKCHQLCIL